MKKVFSFASGCLTILTVVVLALIGTSCTDTETTDSTPFTIYYSGMTDIGPSMTAKVSAPTYLGGTPSEFAIIKVTLAGELVDGQSFVIDPATGSISIENTEKLAVGLYSLSVACVSNGERYEFPDVVSINMMRAVPEGISVEPNLLTIDYADVKTSDAKAQVKTEGEHVSISKYSIAEGEYAAYFAVSASGEVTINKKYNGEILPGVYKVSLVLQTEAGEGIFADAVTFNITSKPLALSYSPAKGKMEEATVGPTSYTSATPTLKGSLEGVVYSIKAVTPSTDKIKIDPATGVLSVAEGHGFKAGQKYVVDVNVKNIYNTGEETGKVFEGAFALEVVSFINPITNFAYENATKTQAVSFSIAHTDAFKGDEVTFELGTLAAELQGQLSIDPATGAVSAKKGNSIPVGSHTVTVKASNVKGEQTASFTLTVEKNKNFFTTITYGNNLGLPVEGNAFQYRITSADELKDMVIPAPTTDLPKGVPVRWELQNRIAMVNTKFNGSGSLTLADVKWVDGATGMIMVTATAGTGEEAVSVSVPVFFHFAGAVNGVTINYTPFVLQANPRKGGRSVAPTVTGVSDMKQLLMDYRRSFSYFNIDGSDSHISGSLSGSTETNFMAQVWRNYYTAVNKKPNYGAKIPMSYYENKASTATALGYVDPADKAVVINPGKWMGEDKVYANGVMSGQITFVTNGSEAGINNGSSVYPILVWFDEKF